MEKLFEEVNIKLTNLIEHTDESNEADVKRTKNYISALSSHIDAINREKNFTLTEDQKKILKRGQVVWVDFGFNIGVEFGGKHPAIILKVKSNYNSLLVIPIDGSVEDNEEKLLRRSGQGYWFKLSNVVGMKKMNRWVNANRILDISVIRVDFLESPTNAYVNFSELSKLDSVIKKYQYIPNKFNSQKVNKNDTKNILKDTK